MINITGFNKKGNHSSNNLKLKSILSILTIGLFIFLGFASIEEGNPIPLCNFHKPPINKTHKLTIEIFDKKTGKPILGEIINFTVYKINKVEDNNGFCELIGKLDGAWEINSGPYGKAIFTQNATYLSPDDYLSIYVGLINNNYYPDSKNITLRDNSSDLIYEMGFLKREVYP